MPPKPVITVPPPPTPPPPQSPATLQSFLSPLSFISLYNLVQLNYKMNIFVIIKILYPLVHATFPLLFYTPVSPFKFLLLDIHNTLKLLITFFFSFYRRFPSKKSPLQSQNLPHLSVSTLFQLPDTSYICYYHSVLHSIYMNPKQVLVFWCFTTQATPYINGIHSTSPPPIHPCPVPWCHNCPVKSPYVPCSNPFN